MHIDEVSLPSSRRITRHDRRHAGVVVGHLGAIGRLRGARDGRQVRHEHAGIGPEREDLADDRVEPGQCRRNTDIARSGDVIDASEQEDRGGKHGSPGSTRARDPAPPLVVRDAAGDRDTAGEIAVEFGERRRAIAIVLRLTRAGERGRRVARGTADQVDIIAGGEHTRVQRAAVAAGDVDTVATAEGDRIA